MITKKKLLCVLLILVCVLGVGVLCCCKRNEKQQYLDRTMESVIENQAKTVGIEEVRDIYLGYTCYFETILDLEKLPNLESIHITGMYYYWDEEPHTPATPENLERVQKLEKEFAEILDKCITVKSINISNTNEMCNLDDLSFFTHGKNLESIGLWSMGDIDYSPIYECKNLKSLGLFGCDISDLTGVEKLASLERLYLDDTDVNSAKDIIKLKSLTYLGVKGTPLADNEEELAKIQEEIPNIEIHFD